MDTLDFDSFALAQQRYDKAEDRMIRDAGFGATRDAQAIIQAHIDKATKIVEEKVKDKTRSSFSKVNIDISMLRPELVALVALQGALDCIANEEDLNTTFHTLGSQMDREMYAQSLAGFDGDMSAKLEKRTRRKGGSVKHRRQAMSAQARKEGFTWKRWDKRTKALVGMWLVEVLTDLDDVFLIIRGEDGRDNADPYLTLTQEALDYSQEMVRHLIDARPVALPLLSPPPAWTSHKLTLESNGRSYSVPLVRKGGLNKVYIKKAIADGTMQEVLDAVTAAGAVSWSLNARIHETVRAAYNVGIENEGLPFKNDLELPERLTDDEWNSMSDDERRVRRMEIGEKIGKNRSLIGERGIFEQDMATAEFLMQHGNCFWTPMNLDYRGRVYSVPYFNFQRQDYVRGMFRFADGIELGATGFYWLMIHLANCGDFEKVSKKTFDERVLWVAENHQRIVDMATHPMLYLWWTEADKPFCFLAAAMEYAEAHKNPSEFISHLPISFDGTCSGLQHLAAMTRCDFTAPLVNLTDNKCPSDVYRAVSERLKVKVEGLVEIGGPSTEVCLKALAYGIDRSLVKRNVMTYSYGSKKFGMTKQLMEDTMRPLQVKVIRKRLDVHPFQVAEDTIVTDKGATVTIPGRNAAKLLGPMTFDTIEEVVRRPAEAMRYLQQISKALSHEGKPTVWHTPLGFPVVLNYPNQKTDFVRLWMHDRGVRIRARVATTEDTQGIDKNAAANAVAPCFVHSYDGCHLQMVVIHANNHGITSVALVHDSFGCHAGVAGKFRRIVTDTFHQLYDEHDVLDDILQEACAQIQTNHHRLPNRSDVSTGTYDLNDIKGALYAFA